MELRDYLRIIIKYLRAIMLGGVLGVLLGLLISWYFVLLPGYVATATISLGGDVSQAEKDRNYLALNDEFLYTYTDMATRDPILQVVINELSLDTTPDDLADFISAEVVEDTQLIEITARDRTPAMAAAIANIIARQLISLPSLRVRGFVAFAEEAPLPTDPDLLWLLVAITGGVLGVALAGGTVFLIEFLRDPVYSPEELAQRTGLTALTTIRLSPDRRRRRNRQTPAWRKVSEAPWLPLTQVCRRHFEALHSPTGSTMHSPTGSTTELPANPHPKPLRVLVTSPTASQEKSVVAANLAVAWTKTGAQVILVDADLEASLLGKWFGLPHPAHQGTHLPIPQADVPAGTPPGGLEGLADVGAGPCDGRQIEGLLQPTGIPGLTLLPAGGTSSRYVPLWDKGKKGGDSNGGLSFQALNQVLEVLDARAEVVVLNGPPLLATGEGALMAAQAHGVFLTLTIGETKMAAAADARDALAMMQSDLWGTILTEGVSK